MTRYKSAVQKRNAAVLLRKPGRLASQYALIIVVSVIAVIPMMGKLIDTDIWEQFTTPVGMICVGGLFGVVMWLAHELMKINKA